MTTVPTCRCQRGRVPDGFTLIEILVAITIFIIMAAMAYGGLRVILESRDSYERNSDRLAELQTFFMLMERDIGQAVDRPVRDNFGDTQPSLSGNENGLELTHAGVRNPAGFARSHLQRVAYVLDQGAVVRLVWPVIDRAQDTEPARSDVLRDVQSMQLRYLDAGRQWQTDWPADKQNDKTPEALPRAVEVSIEYRDWGTLTRLFALPLSLPDESQNEQT